MVTKIPFIVMVGNTLNILSIYLLGSPVNLWCDIKLIATEFFSTSCDS